MNSSKTPPSLGELLTGLLKGAPFALAAAFVLASSVYLLSLAMTPNYQARATVLVTNNAPNSQNFGVISPNVSPLDVSAYRKAAFSSPVLTSTMQNLGVNDSVETFRNSFNIHIEEGHDSSLIDVISTEASPQLAQAKANALALSLIRWDEARSTETLNRIRETLEQQITVLDQQIVLLQQQGAAQEQLSERINLRAQQQDRLAYATALSSSPTSLLSIMEPAVLPTLPSSPQPFLNAVIAGFLAALITYALLYAKDALKLTGKSIDLEMIGLPLLASLPNLSQISQTASHKSIDFLRSNLMLTSAQGPKVILLTSAEHEANQGRVAIALAESFSRSGKQTLVVDANLKDPQIAPMYGMPRGSLEHASLATWLYEPQSTRDVVKAPGNESGFFIIPNFKGISSALFSNFNEALKFWKQEYDVVIINAGSVLEGTDTLSLAPLSTDSVLVAGENTKAETLRNARRVLQSVGGHVTGMVSIDNANSKMLNNAADFYQTPHLGLQSS